MGQRGVNCRLLINTFIGGSRLPKLGLLGQFFFIVDANTQKLVSMVQDVEIFENKVLVPRD